MAAPGIVSFSSSRSGARAPRSTLQNLCMSLCRGARRLLGETYYAISRPLDRGFYRAGFVFWVGLMADHRSYIVIRGSVSLHGMSDAPRPGCAALRLPTPVVGGW